MKVTLDWLQDYVDFDLPAEVIAERLTQAGLETEGIEQVGDETVIELETTSNRPDHLGVLGVAREISWICDSEFRLPNLSYETIDKYEGTPLDKLLTLDVQDPERCPRYIARLAVDVEVGPSPQWLISRIEALGLRPVNNVVDLSNFVLFEYGQPLHAFDYDKLDSHTVIIRRAAQSEEFTAINGRTYHLDREDLMIADSNRGVALAGIMGGLHSEVSESTSKVLLESAWFSPVPVRTSSRRLALASDSSYRFERRVDPKGVDFASRRFLSLLQEIAGANVLAGEVEFCDDQWFSNTRQRVSIRPSRVTQVLGLELSKEEIKDNLVKIGFTETPTEGDNLEFITPSFRADVDREIDLIEEVARVYGFNRIPEGQLDVFPIEESLEAGISTDISNAMVGAGYQEALTYAFTTTEDSSLEELWSATDPFEVRNPVRSAEKRMRRSLLPRLLQAVRGNHLHGVDEVRLFEQARVFHRRPGVPTPVEREHLAWCASAGDLSFRDARGIADSLLQLLRIQGATWTPIIEESCGFVSNKTAQVTIAGTRVGLVGFIEVSGIPGGVWAGELDLAALFPLTHKTFAFTEFSRHPSIVRDLNIVLAESTTWQEITDVVNNCQLKNFSELKFCDLYRGKQVPVGKKSVLFSLSFQAEDRTLTHDEVEHEVEQLLERLGDRFEAELRS